MSTLCNTYFPASKDMNDMIKHLSIQSFHSPYNKNMVTQQSRINSFSNSEWLLNSKPSFEKVTQAGFYYMGCKDYVKCFFCGGGLWNWEREDDPWTEHTKWFPKCIFLQLNKEDHSIEKMNSLLPSENDTTVKEKTINSELSSLEKTEQLVDSLSLKETDVDTYRIGNTELICLQQLKNEVGKLREARLCKICMDKEACIVFLPCSHLISCSSCATSLSNCALCRHSIKAIIRTYLS